MIASAGLIRICVTASESIIGIDALGEEPGLKSVAKTTARPASIIRASIRILFRTKRINRSWQKHRLDVGFCQRADAIRSRLFEMIGGRCSQFCRQLCPTAVSQLIDVHPQLQSVLLGCSQNAARFFGVEVVLLTKDVAVFRQASPRAIAGNILSMIERNIAGTILPKFRRKGMRAEKCRNRFQRRFLPDAADHPQNFQFILKSESVTGFCFHRCRSILQKPARTLFRERKSSSALAARVARTVV